jgi:hypothetical protein
VNLADQSPRFQQLRSRLKNRESASFTGSSWATGIRAITPRSDCHVTAGGSHAGSHTDERLSDPPDSSGHPTGMQPRSWTDLHERGRMYGKLRIKRPPGCRRHVRSNVRKPADHWPDLCTDLCTRRVGMGRDEGDAEGRHGCVPPVRRGQRHRCRPGETAETPVVLLITQRS